MTEAPAHACNGAGKRLPRPERIGWERKKKCRAVAHELQWDWTGDKEKHVVPRERWGEMRKSSSFGRHHTVFHMPQESVSNASVPLPLRAHPRTHTAPRTHPPIPSREREDDSVLSSCMIRVMLIWSRSVV